MQRCMKEKKNYINGDAQVVQGGSDNVLQMFIYYVFSVLLVQSHRTAERDAENIAIQITKLFLKACDDVLFTKNIIECTKLQLVMKSLRYVEAA